MIRWKFISLGGLLAMVGCARLPADGGFSDVSQLSVAHGVTGLMYRPDDHAIAAASKTLLATPLTPDSAVQLALVNSHRLQATFESFGVSQATYVQTVTPSNPVLDIDFKVANGQSPKWDVSILQSLFELLNLPTRQKIATAELEAARYRTAEAVLDLTRQVRLATLDAQAADRVLDLRDQLAKTADVSGEFADRLNKAGNLSPLEQNRRRADAAQAQLDLADAKLAATLAHERLATVIGLVDPSGIRLAPWDESDAGEIPSADVAKQTEHQNLSLLALKQDLLASGERAGVARSTAWVDQLDVGAVTERDDHWFVGPALSVSLPVFSQGQAKTLLADATAREQLQTYLADRTELNSSTRQELAMLDAARQRVTTYQQTILPMRRETFEDMQRRYNGMFTDAFGLMQAKQDELLAQVELANALHEFRRDEINLRHLLNGGSISVPSPGSPGEG